MVAEKKECSGTEVQVGKFHSLADCGSACKGVASMFVVQTGDFGGTRCVSERCECYCEISATYLGTCDIIDNKGYRLYKYNSGYYNILYN